MPFHNVNEEFGTTYRGMAPGGRFLLFTVILLASLVLLPASAMIPAWNTTNNGGYISDLAISDDGSRLITGSVTGVATVYDQGGPICEFFNGLLAAKRPENMRRLTGNGALCQSS